MVEHRCTVRRPHECDIYVDSPSGDPKRVRSRNIGAGGIFVDSVDAPFALNTAVTVAFRLRHGKHATDFRLRAMVVRVAPVGAAIMFLDTDAETLGRLDGLLRRMPKAAVQAHLPADSDSQIDRSVEKIANV
ncbi:MAG TPA: PilZ domain-containing protein [Burkholderiales bacterium]|jgi:hypothetical protein